MEESSGVGVYMRNRRFGSYFDASSGTNFGGNSKVLVKEEAKKRWPEAEVYAGCGGGGWLSSLISWIRIVVCFVTMTFTTFEEWALVMLVLLPWPCQRIRQGNIYGHVTGRLLIETSIHVVGCSCNHQEQCVFDHFHRGDQIQKWKASAIQKGTNSLWNLFLSGTANSLQLARIRAENEGELRERRRTEGCKRERRIEGEKWREREIRILWIYNSSMLLIPAAVKLAPSQLQSINQSAACLDKSKAAKLKQFSTQILHSPLKGFVHLALQSQLPVVPIVLTGTHLAWRKTCQAGTVNCQHRKGLFYPRII